jgi:phage-related tail protein
MQVDEVWEPTSRVYIKQSFNLTEGAQLVKDIHDAAVNYTVRTGAGLEVENARFLYSRFVQNNMQMKKALEYEREDMLRRMKLGLPKRVKRNIFGGILSTLTGLVTEEQLRAEHEAEKALESKVARMLSHETDVEKSLDLLSREITGNINQSNLEFKKLHYTVFRDSMYWSRKEGGVSACQIIFKLGGGVRDAIYMH